MSCLKKALKYRKRGWSVIPIGQNKRPLFAWKEYTERLPRRKEIKKWWKKYPDANVGVITGKISGITVVDVEKGGMTAGYPETRTVRTGGGGFHFYYKYSERFKNAVRIKELTDIRNDGGYVIAPPSIHQSGKKYKILSKKKIQPFPVDLFIKEEVKNKQSEMSSKFDGAKKGGRNQKAASICGSLLKMVPYKYREEIVWPAMKDWNQKNNPPLDEDELRKVFDSISSRADFNQEDRDKEILEADAMADKHLKEITERRKGQKYLPSGIKRLDVLLNGGFRNGELVLIGARPSIGKTSLALSFAYNLAALNYNVLFFSIEMSAIDLYDRLLSFAINCRCSEVIKGEVDDEKLLMGYKKLRKLPISISELSSATSDDVSEITKDRTLNKKVDVVIVDYLQFLRDQDESERVRIGKISRNLKTLARQLNVPVIVPTQLRRTAEEHAPRIGELKESSNLEQDADIVLLLHRDRSPEKGHQATLDVAKNRKGETGLCTLTFDSRTTMFK